MCLQPTPGWRGLDATLSASAGLPASQLACLLDLPVGAGCFLVSLCCLTDTRLFLLQRWCWFRPSPLFRARRLEKALGTPARIYYK